MSVAPPANATYQGPLHPIYYIYNTNDTKHSSNLYVCLPGYCAVYSIRSEGDNILL